MKYNVTLPDFIGFTIEDIVLQKAPYLHNCKTGQYDVLFTEISLLGINTDGNDYIIEEDIYNSAKKMIAWSMPLDLTSFVKFFKIEIIVIF